MTSRSLSQGETHKNQQISAFLMVENVYTLWFYGPYCTIKMSFFMGSVKGPVPNSQKPTNFRKMQPFNVSLPPNSIYCNTRFISVFACFYDSQNSQSFWYWTHSQTTSEIRGVKGFNPFTALLRASFRLQSACYMLYPESDLV